jgi:adenylate cyclase
MGDIRSVVEWLTDGARSAQRPEDLLRELCHRVIDGGIPVWRAAIFVNTLHPNIFGRRFTWQAGKGVVVQDGEYALMDTDEFRQSPITAVRVNGQPIRRHLAEADCPDDFPVLAELRSEGATDYVAAPLVFTDSSVHVATWATQQPGGFTPVQFSDLEAIVAPLTRVVEIRAWRRTATNLLNTYVGRQAGERILMGEIRRGHVEEIRAVIWLSDMRGFTATAECLPPQELVDLLNQYFDCQVPTILDHGGEVLKFMGDGLLAIFPLHGNGDDASEVCTRALACAREAEALIEKLDAPVCVETKNMVRFGLALHVGQVMYGNIGGGNRLDFTCIGPAVNLAARLEKVAAQMGQTIVASAAFASQVPGQFTQRGECAVTGFSLPQAVFCLTAPQQ